VDILTSCDLLRISTVYWVMTLLLSLFSW